MRFSQVAGHAMLKAKLITNLREGRIPHAQFFLGPRGSGGLPMALAYAQYLLCAEPGPADPCGSCPSCQQMEKLGHPDVHFAFPIFLNDRNRTCTPVLPDWRDLVMREPYLDAALWRDRQEGENKQLRMGVDIAAEITRQLSLKAYAGGWRVMLVWLPELMDAPAANKLLKVLEEPEPRTVFLLVGHDADAILPTIISRTQLVKVPALAEADLVRTLRSRFDDLPEPDAQAAALRSAGDLLEATALVEKGEEELFILFRDWLRACYALKAQDVVEFAEHFHKMGRERQKGLVRYGLYLVRLSMLIWQRAGELVRTTGEELKFVTDVSHLLTARNIAGLREELEVAHQHLERNANPKVLFMDLSYRMHGLLKQR
ncbi:MAG: hypothetical protein H6594_00090 [Flavobacteriales bacterium]|nr:hypothetical protein [Flavobacteriales bacterium]